MPRQSVELHVDPACPWCWLTALWLFEVETVRPLAITTRVFSLAEVNRTNDSKKDSHGAGERALRVLVAAREAAGEPAIRAVYRELGEAAHERAEPLGEAATLRSAVAAAGLEPELADRALADGGTLAAVLAEHAAAVERGIFGVPTLSLEGGPAFFGPVIDSRVGGDDAGRLWDIVSPVLEHPGLFELKRNRTRRPQVGRYRTAGVAAG